MRNIIKILPFGIFIVLMLIMLRIIRHNTSPFEWIAETFPNQKGIIGIIIALLLVAVIAFVSFWLTRLIGKRVILPIEKKRNPEEFKQHEPVLLHTLINHHFCIKNASPAEIVNKLDIAYVENTVFDMNFDFNFLYNERNENYEKRFLLFGEINNWSYIMMNVWDFDKNIEMAKLLSAKLQTEVYYFVIDPWIFTCCWIVADNGKIIRAYYESHGQVMQEQGYLEIENSIIEELKNEGNDFWEEKYWRLNEEICQPIDIINTQTEWDALKAELK